MTKFELAQETARLAEAITQGIYSPLRAELDTIQSSHRTKLESVNSELARQVSSVNRGLQQATESAGRARAEAQRLHELEAGSLTSRLAKQKPSLEALEKRCSELDSALKPLGGALPKQLRSGGMPASEKMWQGAKQYLDPAGVVANNDAAGGWVKAWERTGPECVAIKETIAAGLKEAWAFASPERSRLARQLVQATLVWLLLNSYLTDFGRLAPGYFNAFSATISAFGGKQAAFAGWIGCVLLVAQMALIAGMRRKSTEAAASDSWGIGCLVPLLPWIAGTMILSQTTNSGGAALIMGFFVPFGFAVALPLGLFEMISTEVGVWTWVSLLANTIAVYLTMRLWVEPKKYQAQLRAQLGTFAMDASAAELELRALILSDEEAIRASRVKLAEVASRCEAETVLAVQDASKRIEALRESTQVQIRGLDAERHDAITLVLSRWAAECVHTRQRVDVLWQAVGLAGTGWESSHWQRWKAAEDPEFAARIGVLELCPQDLLLDFPAVDLSFKLPALVPFADGQFVLLETDSRDRDGVVAAVQSLLLRTLATAPPGALRFVFLDPVGLGQSVAQLVALGDADDRLIGGKVWAEPQHIEHQLGKLAEHLETVIQKYLRGDHASIREYNLAAGETAEAFRVLVIFDFPANFTEASARRLLSILRNGPRCGVFTVLVRDKAREMPHRVNFNTEFRPLAFGFYNQLLNPTPS